MSTVDLTKVAGFKAVDAEGNDMGVVSLSEMTNMVKESIIQEAVAMQSVSTLAEASTLAATDTYEDKLDISDTFSYVRTLDSSGNPKRTSQNALATVVGGLIGTVNMDKNGLMAKGQNVILVSSESIKQNGYTYIFKANSNISIVDVSLTHPYRSAVRVSVLISYEPGKVSCGKSFIVGSESLAELYYNIASDGCEVYVKNLQSGPMAVSAIVYRGILEAPISIAELPSGAIKF